MKSKEKDNTSSTLLIVDDSRAMRTIIKSTIGETGLAVEKIHSAPNGEEALNLLESGLRPDAIISDWKMPKMDGIEFLEYVRFQYPAMPFGFITAQASPHLKSETIKAGADFFVTKPFNTEEIYAVLQTYI